MRLEQAVIDLWMAGVVASLISIVLFFVLGAGISVRTVVEARRRARRPSPLAGQMSRWCSVSELDDLDQALDQILAEDRTAHPQVPGR